MTDPEVDPLLAYMRTYGQTYAPEALRRHLVAHGYDDRQVMAALVAYQREREAGAGGEVRAPSERGIELAVLGVVAGVFVLVTGTCMGWNGSPDDPNNFTSPVSCSVMVLGLALIVFSILWYWRPIGRRRSRSSIGKQP